MHVVHEDHYPWYRQLWPWLLMSVPAATVVAAIFTIVIAVKTDDGLVEADYYKQGLAIHRNAAQTEAAHALGVIADVRFDTTRGEVRVALTHPEPAPASLTLSVRHPTLSGHDQQITLWPVTPGLYVGNLEPLIDAHWRLTLTPPQRHWRLEGRFLTQAAGAIRLH